MDLDTFSGVQMIPVCRRVWHAVHAPVSLKIDLIHRMQFAADRCGGTAKVSSTERCLRLCVRGSELEVAKPDASACALNCAVFVGCEERNPGNFVNMVRGTAF